MPLSINTNVASMTAQRSFISSNSALETAFERLSTGKRINSAVDDAAGLSIAQDLKSQVGGMNQAIRNVNDGISIIQIAEGALDEATNILQRLRDITVQGGNETLSTDERTYLKTEADALIEALDKIDDTAKFNGSSVFSSSDTIIQSGAGNADEISISTGLAAAGTFLNAGAVTTATLVAAKDDVLVDTHANAQLSIARVDDALKDVATRRANLGAKQAELESTVRNLANVAENTAAAAGRIMDTDYAAETANLTKAQILQQAATSILAQANAQPQAILSLLQ